MPKLPEMLKIRVATVRSYPKKGDLERNGTRLLEILDRVAPQHPDVVVTPECFLDGYMVTKPEVNRRTVRRYGIDPKESDIGKAVSAWAKENQAWVILGCTRLLEKGASNSAVVYNRSGRYVGAYDKTHCRGHDQKFVVGNELPVFKADFGKFGIVICADRRWPESIRTLALKGAEVIFNPTYGQCDEKNKWVMRTRAWESETPIVFTHPRQSLVLDAKGNVLIDETDPNTGYSVCEVNLTNVRKLRADKSSFLNQRRPDLYKL